MTPPATAAKSQNTTASAAAKAEDFLPLLGIDHVELYVGNVYQAARS